MSIGANSIPHKMEFPFSCVTISLAVFLIVIYLLFYFSKKEFKVGSSSSLPPGNMGFPIIGETFQFLSNGINGEPEKFISERMAKYSPQAFKTSLFGAPMIVLCGATGNKFLYSNENKLVRSWWPSSFSKIFQSSNQVSLNEEMKKMKKYLPQFLGAEALRNYIGIMDSIAENHFASEWENKEYITIFPLAKKYTFSIASRLFISIEDPEHIAKFFKPFEAIALALFSMPIDFPGMAFNRGIKASNMIRKELLVIIKQRKINLAQNVKLPARDILTHMLLSPDEDGKFMNETDIADKILGMLVGGFDTASATITLIVKYLAELPEIYNAVLKEQIEISKLKDPGDLLDWGDIQRMKYSWNVACEVLRLAPALQGAFREALTDFTYAGFSIPKGWKLYWNAHSTHRNPKYFPEPEKFDPLRFEGNGPAPYTYVPFGGGPRMCPGKEYARLEILVFMHNLVKRFKWENMLPNEKIIVNPLPAPEKGLPVRLFRHQKPHLV